MQLILGSRTCSLGADPFRSELRHASLDFGGFIDVTIIFYRVVPWVSLSIWCIRGSVFSYANMLLLLRLRTFEELASLLSLCEEFTSLARWDEGRNLLTLMFIEVLTLLSGLVSALIL